MDDEQAIDAELAATPALTIMSLDDKVLSAFITDVAQDIYSHTEICERYGVSYPAGMLDLIRRPGIAKRIKERRAIWNSGESIQDRNRAYYGTVAMEGASKLDKLIQAGDTPPALVMEGITIASRNAGIYNSGGGGKVEGSTQVGAQFAINIVFSGAGKTERIGTTVAVGPGTGSTTVEGPAPPLTIDADEYVASDDDE